MAVDVAPGHFGGGGRGSGERRGGGRGEGFEVVDGWGCRLEVPLSRRERRDRIQFLFLKAFASSVND